MLDLPPKTSSASPPATSADEERIVIIADGDESNASHVGRQLQRGGVKNPVVTFHNGDDLHAFLVTAAQKDEGKPCVMFLDPQMPGANGYDPVRWILREKSLSDMKVVVFSETNEPEEIEHAAELGVHLFVKKHPDLSSLSVIVNYLGGTAPAARSEREPLTPK